MRLDSQALQLVMVMQKTICDLLSEQGMTSQKIALAVHVAEDAARIIKEYGQVPADIPSADE